MAYTTMKVWGSETLTAGDMTTYLTDNIEYLKGVSDGLVFSGAKVDRAGAGNQSIPDASDTDVAFTNEVFDADGWWSSGSTLTVPGAAVPSGSTAIYVQAIMLARFVANGTGGRKVLILRNGSEEDSASFAAISGETTTVQLTSIFTVEDGDTIKMQVRQNSGGNLNMDAARLTVYRIAPTA